MSARAKLAFCIPIEQRQGGGLYSFLGNFRDWLGAHGHAVTEDPAADYVVLFANSFMVPYELIAAEKRRRPALRVVQRMDGVAREYGRTDDADARQARVNLLADLTVFQSEYSRHVTREKCRIVSGDGPVIYNPVDVLSFTPDGPRAALPGARRVAYVTWSTNPRKGAPELYRAAAANPDVDFVLVGQYEGAPDLPNLHALGVVARGDLPAVLRGCDAFLTFSENESCPNAVLEAMACGLPVLYLDSGAAREIVGDGGVDTTPATFRVRLDETLARREEIARGARARAKALFAPERVFAAYLAAIEAAQRRPLPSTIGTLRLLTRGYPVLPPAAARVARALRRRLSAAWP